MKTVLKRGLASLMMATMVFTTIPVQADADVVEAGENEQSEVITLGDGIYQVPVSEITAPRNPSSGSEWLGRQSTNLAWQLDQYVTVTVENGEYTIDFSIYGGEEIDALQIAKTGEYTESADFYTAVLDAEYLEGKITEEDIADLETAGVVTSDETFDKMTDTTKNVKSQGTAVFSYRTTKPEGNYRMISLGKYYSGGKYQSKSVSRMRVELDWENAVRAEENSDNYSVVVMNVSRNSNSLGYNISDERKIEFPCNAVIEKNIALEKKDEKLYAKVSLKENDKYEITSLQRVAETSEITASNFISQSGAVYEDVSVENGTFTIPFHEINETVYLKGKMNGSYVFLRIRLVHYKTEAYTQTNGSVSVEGESDRLKDATLDVAQYTKANAPEYVKADNVKSTLTMATKKGYYIYEVSLKDSEASGLALENTVVSVEIPKNLNQENLVVCTVDEVEVFYKDYAAAGVDSYVKDGKVYVDMSGASDIKIILFERVQTENVIGLEEGIYDVTATLWNASGEYQSMAGSVVKPEARLLVKDEKTYLQITFTKAAILYQPAFLSKAYAVDVTQPSTESVVKRYHSGKVIEYWDDEEVKAFAAQCYAKNTGVSATAPETVEIVNQSMLQNNLKYIKTMTLDITNSIEKSGIHKGKVRIAFCCDIMDTLYSGIPGSDAGFNEADLMVSEIKANTKLTEEEILGGEHIADKSVLEPLYEQAFEISRTRSSYSTDSYNAFVPAWSLTYIAYNDYASTQERVDAAVTAMEEAIDNLVRLKELSVLVNGASASKTNCEETTYTEFSNAKTAANAVLKKTNVTKEEVEAQMEAFLAAKEALLPSEKYIETVSNAVNAALATEQGTYTSKTYNAYIAAARDTKTALEAETPKYFAIADAYKVLTNAKAALAEAGEKAELAELVAEAAAIDTGKYTKNTALALEAALEAAEEVLADEEATAKEITSAKTTLQKAVDGLCVLEDGKYIVPVTLWKSNDDSVSMGNEALVQKAIVEVKDGKATLYFSFKKMKFSGLEGYLSSFDILTNIEFNANNYPVKYENVPATVISTYDEVDEYNKDTSTDINCAGKLYPKQMKISVNLEEDFIWAHVYVPVMGSLGMGNQICRLKVDYASAKAYADVNTEELEAAIAAAEAVEKDKFTEETILTLEHALEAAKEVKNSQYILQTDVNNAVKALTQAYDALLEKTVEIPTEGTTEAGTEVSTEKTTKRPEETTTVADGNKVNPAAISLRLNKKKATIYTKAKKTVQLTATVQGTDKNVVWTSSNKKIATVNAKGKVIAKKAGKVYITAKVGKETAVCQITVKKPALELSKKKLVLNKGRKVKLKVKCTPKGKVKYKSSNKKIVKVTSKGVVVAKEKGKAKITVSCNGVKKVIKVTVK